MKRFNLSEWAVTHRPMVLFLVIATLIVGALSFNRLGRLEDPNFDVPQMTAIVVWPGASAQDVKDQVLNRIERTLQELDHFDYVRSFARQGYGGITLWMKGGSSKAELDNAWYQVRKKIGDVRQEFPDGVRGPFFNDEYNDRYSVLFALSAPDLSMAELLAVTEDVKRRVQGVPGAAKVDVLGKQAERVYVEISTRRLAALGLAPTAVFDALARQNLVTPAGSADATHDRVHVRVDGGLRSAADVANVSLDIGGQLLRLADIASVRTGYEDPPSFTIRHNGVPVLAMGVTMQSNGNVLDFGRALQERLAQVRQELPAGVEIQQYADQPRVVADSVWEFERSFLEALAIVLAVSFLFLGWRTGIVVAASVPLVLGLVAAVMYAAGWNLDRISLGALIIALGLLVDDAIIAVEMMVVKLEQGWDRLRAASYAYTSTAFPMLTGTLITAAGFMPVGFAKSIAGQYAGGIFWVVGVALILSWLVAVIFTPYLGVVLLPRKLAAGTHHDVYDRPIYHRLRGVVDWAVQHRAWVLGITVLLFGIAGAGMLTVQQQFFPTAARPELLVELRLREGASFAATERQVKRLEAQLAQDPDVEFFTAYTGAGTPIFYLSILPELPNPGFAQFVIKTAGIEQRERVRARLMELFAKDEVVPDAKARVTRLEFGPPVGFPVQFRVIGPDKAQVREIAYQVRDKVRQSELVRDTQLDWNEQVRSVQVHVDQDKARLLGLSSADVQGLVQSALDGAPVTQIRRGEELVDVVVRATPEERKGLGQLRDLQVFTRSGVTVPLSQLARIEPAFEEPATQPRHGAHRPQRRRRRRARSLRHGTDSAVAAADRRQLAGRLSHRGRRRHRGERQGQRGTVCRVSGDVRGDAHAADDPAPELLAPVHGVHDGTAGADRRGAGAVAVPGAVRFRRAARRDRAGRDDHAQLDHPRGSDRPRRWSWGGAVGRDRRCHGAALTPCRADRRRRSAGDDPAHAQRVLGTDGHLDHGRPGGGHSAHAGLRARAVRRVVPRPAKQCRGCTGWCIARHLCVNLAFQGTLPSAKARI
jgi:multidrug efflux pump